MARQQLIWAGTGRGPAHRRVIPIKPCCGPVPSSTWPSVGQVRTSWWAFYSSGKSGTVCWGQRESVAEPGSDTLPRGTEGLLWGFSNSGLSLSGVSLDVILESETKNLTVLLGEPATFHCNITGGNWKNYQMSWYKRNENNVLTLVYSLSNNSNENVRGNFKGKINTSKNQYILNIQKATIKDVGTYYCGSDIHSATVLILIASNLPESNQGSRSNERPSLAKISTTPEVRPLYNLNRNIW